MNTFGRRTFLKLLGQGTAVLGMGLSSKAWAQTGRASTSSGGQKFTSGKYQIFEPGVYFDWEKKMVEERLVRPEIPAVSRWVNSRAEKDRADQVL